MEVKVFTFERENCVNVDELKCGAHHDFHNRVYLKFQNRKKKYMYKKTYRLSCEISWGTDSISLSEKSRIVNDSSWSSSVGNVLNLFAFRCKTRNFFRLEIWSKLARRRSFWPAKISSKSWWKSVSSGSCWKPDLAMSNLAPEDFCWVAWN